MINSASATFIRPANTTAYASGDEISNSITAGSALPLRFDGLADSMFGTGKILNAKFFTNQQNFAGALRLYLFNDVPTMSGDNNPYALLTANARSFIGFITWASPYLSPTGSQVTIGTIATSQQIIVSKDNNGGNPIYGVLIANGAITPISSQQFTVELYCEPKVTVN